MCRGGKPMFKPGDRVVCISDCASKNRFLTAGCTGTVIDVADIEPPISVVWDEDIDGHTLGNRCKNGYGWRVYENEIALL